MLIACCCCYREGPTLRSTVASAVAGCDYTYVFEGPIGDAPATGEPSPLDELRDLSEHVLVKQGAWGSDAEKRTDALEFVRALHVEDKSEPVWVLWLDGDELLIWPEYLLDWTHRVEAETGAGGFAIRLVEFDGSVAKCYSKIIRADIVTRYLHSSYNVEIYGSNIQLALPNVKICAAGGIPTLPMGVTLPDLDDGEQERWLAENRPPLQGEPHILHRSSLRHPERTAQRQSEAEADFFADEEARLGI
jgi:hypothetical protein